MRTPSLKRVNATMQARAHLLAVSRRLFEARGYEAVTMREVAREAGVSTGAIFAAHADKASLFLAATGHPAPDVAAFLLKVSLAALDETVEQLGSTHRFTDIGEEAALLRHHLIGHHA